MHIPPLDMNDFGFFIVINYSINYFCPALTKLALDLHLHVNFRLSGLFFKASNWLIYWLLTVVLAPYLSD